MNVAQEIARLRVERHELRGTLERLLQAAEVRVPERGHGYDYPDLAEGDPLKEGVISAKFVADECRKALGLDEQSEP